MSEAKTSSVHPKVSDRSVKDRRIGHIRKIARDLLLAQTISGTDEERLYRIFSVGLIPGVVF